ncbi:unnamed protein product [Gongylonema pulchrum]|uniref:G_PROTEIN_RECEP_F1_2 domain-containing protein n=1 Tax=Gongylonema pulchrum TaxID=637853 RepID=A0A183D9F7_9BILA|nr:unnamed protein product [Gongylonema pulchrum]
MPSLDAVTGAMLTNFVCFVPSVLLLLSRRPNGLTIVFVVVDIVCITVQAVAFWALPCSATDPDVCPFRCQTKRTAFQDLRIYINVEMHCLLAHGFPGAYQ